VTESQPKGAEAPTRRGAARIGEIKAKSILVRSNLPDADYVANPYVGCQFGCLYCYATFMGRYVHEPRDQWGAYVYAKVNAVELAREELSRWGDRRRQSRVLLSSVTDAYQGVEKRYRLTRGILEAFAEAQYPGQIGLLTKSPLVLRDLDLLQKLPDAEVGLTVTTTDDALSRLLEVRAPLASRRLATLRQLCEARIPAFAFVGPLLPHFRYQPEKLDQLLGAIAGTGVRQVYVEQINLSSYIRARLRQELADAPEHVRAVYQEADTHEHRQSLDEIVDRLLRKHGLAVRLGGTIYHPDQAGSSRVRTKNEAV
jgi:DNA repair photolyase